MSWQDRLRVERKELGERAFKLGEFMDTDEFDALSSELQVTMFVQAYAMKMYTDALDGRLGLIDG